MTTPPTSSPPPRPPLDWALVTRGRHLFNDGQTAVITAPAALTNNGQLYMVQGFALSGAAVSSATSFSKSRSPPSILPRPPSQYVAVYRAYPLLPQIIGVADNYPNPMPATTGFLADISIRPQHEDSLPRRSWFSTNAAPGSGAGDRRQQWHVDYIRISRTTPIKLLALPSAIKWMALSRCSFRACRIFTDTSCRWSPNVTNIIVHSTSPPAPVVAISNPTNGGQLWHNTETSTIIATSHFHQCHSRSGFLRQRRLAGRGDTHFALHLDRERFERRQLFALRRGD